MKPPYGRLKVVVSNVPRREALWTSPGTWTPDFAKKLVGVRSDDHTPGIDATETMRQFALALLEAADADGDMGAMTRYLVEQSDALDQDTLVAISTVAVTIMAVASGVHVQAALEAIWEAVSE
jgi:hypothetical protein